MQCNIERLKTNQLSPMASFGLMVSIVVLISSVMCLAMVFVAVVMPGLNIATLYLFCASLVLGLIAVLTIQRLQGKRRAR